jgi:hypothetical protein
LGIDNAPRFNVHVTGADLAKNLAGIPPLDGKLCEAGLVKEADACGSVPALFADGRKPAWALVREVQRFRHALASEKTGPFVSGTFGHDCPSGKKAIMEGAVARTTRRVILA